MSELLFSSSTTVLSRFLTKLKEASSDNPFSAERNGVMENVIESILRYTKEWDLSTRITASYIGNALISRLVSATEGFNNKSFTSENELDDIFSLLFRFSLEMDLTARLEIEFDLNSMRVFAVSNKKFFSDTAIGQIDYALSSLPISILKGIISSSGFKSLSEFINLINDSKKERDEIITVNSEISEKSRSDAEQKEIEWKKYISDKQQEVNNIKTSLDSYQTAFNFVGLHDGFKQLSEQKKNEKKWSLRLVAVLGLLAFAPLLVEAFIAINTDKKISSLYDAIYLIPVFSITFILIYYFRIALQNLNSINAQLSQIELRKTLCQFIQSYGEYSAKMKREDSESLAKFENIIFSGIITNGDNIPSTFDGLEHIVKLVGDFKK